MLNDDFDPRAGEANDVKTSAGDFGDFETAFGSNSPPAQKQDDGFADFSSAFSSAPPQSSNQYSSTISNMLGTTPNVLPNVIPPPNMTSNVPNLLMGVPPTGAPATTLLGGPQSMPTLQSPTAPNNSDLLGDLNFGSLNMQPQQGFEPMSNNNMGLFQGNNNLLDGLSASKLPFNIIKNVIIEKSIW